MGDIATGLDMNITGALIKGILQQLIDDIDDMLIVGIRILYISQFQQLLKISRPIHSAGTAAAGTAHRFGQTIKFHRIAL